MWRRAPYNGWGWKLSTVVQHLILKLSLWPKKENERATNPMNSNRVPLAKGKVHALARGKVHALARGKVHPLARGKVHPLARRKVHPIAR